VAAAWWGWTKWKSEEAPRVHFNVTPLAKSDFRLTIDSTGTIEPTELVDVGAQVGGIILEFGKDVNGNQVDYASEVKKDQLLARIDDVVVKNDVKRAEAQIAQAKAQITSAKANIEQAKAQHNQAKRDRDRAEKLGAGDALSQSSYDQYISSEENTRAAVAVAEAGLEQAEATLQSAEASLETEKRNLEYTVITSPVDGIIVNRLVNLGQTVVSSMNATSLFLVAKDLSKIQIWAAVNEADIANVYAGQKVTFTVDAYPGKSFEGVVNKIRPNATMSSNVVTFVVEVDADNPDKMILPYLTANVNFIVQDYQDTFAVPNTALRFNPTPDMIAPEARPGKGPREGQMPPAPAADQQPADKDQKTESEGTIWVKEGSFVRPLRVKTGESNGMLTPVFSDELKEGLQIVTSVTQVQEAEAEATEGEDDTTNNPFAPPRPKGNKKDQGPPPRP
jgi:HlyD family secretion protein